MNLPGFSDAILLTDTTAVTGAFRAIQVIEDCTFTTLTGQGFTKNGTVTAVTGADLPLTQGSIIYGTFVAVTLATGKVILYK